MPLIAKDRQLIKVKKGKLLGPVCNEVLVEENVEDLISGDTLMKLKVFRAQSEDIYLMERKNFDVQKLFEFLNSKNVKLLDDLLLKQEVYDYVSETDYSAPTVYQHKQLGFVSINGELCFLAHHPIGLSDSYKATSTYHNPLATKPVGTMDGWLDFVNSEIIGHPKLELALALAAMGPVTYFLRTQMVISTNPIINIAGPSSIGKTTFLRICASVYGSPDETNGLIEDFHATENAFSARLAQSHGMTLCCDESTLQPDWDFTKFGYSISKGVDKLRCNQDGSIKHQNRFIGPVIISGEKKFLDQTQKNEGLFARFVTISDALTDSAEQAERITYGCSCNYGHAIHPLVECLLKSNVVLADVYRKDIEWFKNKIESSCRGIDSRILKTYSLIITSARVAKIVWDLDINIDTMCKYLLSIFNEQLPESNRVVELYEKIIAGVAANQSKFINEKEKKEHQIDSDCWGKFAFSNYQHYVWVSPLALDKMLKNGGILDSITLKDLHSRGLVKYFGDRYLKQTLLGKAKVSCYCFLARRLDSTPPKNTKKKTKESKLSSSRINLLLSDDDEKDNAEVTGNDNSEI